ncbi:aminotransferase class I/II-fold pyridoxal phosphate-dependent enzyme [Variovorax dokdonensis]|uniref:Aminotransferase class I/II-fold pyridoxal phosphate-dependent enzyme n=1 Tax=Variovorax dokdonensis TaxID=344883 RepID=A0ABT7NBK3_9BURK|nr:aminotransferase class I/II-fold pyridoxal phosphate-dependent enzyme [Variovorax dokdonensis]
MGRDAHFFLLGGSSLTAAQLANRIRERFGCRIALTTIMQTPVLAEMAACIDQAAPAAEAVPTRGESRVEGPASEAQARMVFLQRQHAGSAMNNIPLSLALAGPIDPARLSLAADRLVDCHPELRSRFMATPEGLRVRYDADAPALRHLHVEDETEAARAIEALQCEAFEPETGPLWRIALVTRRDTESCALALCVHHAIADGVTLMQWLDELDALYRAEALPTVERLAYIDYGLDVLANEPSLRRQLHDNRAALADALTRSGFQVGPSETGIVPVYLPDGMAGRFNRRLDERGLFVNVMEYPMVSPGAERLRFSLMARHTQADIDTAVGIVRETAEELGLRLSRHDAGHDAPQTHA